jgi:hypothetical protein
MIPVVAEDPLAPSALSTPDSWLWFTETGRTRAPSRRNEVTLPIGRDAVILEACRREYRACESPAFWQTDRRSTLGQNRSAAHWDRIEVLPISASMLATRWRFQTNSLNCLKFISDKNPYISS